MNDEMKTRVETAMKNLKRNRMDAYYCDTKEQAQELVKTLIKKGDVISCGGSVTLKQTGIYDIISSSDYNFLDRSACKTHDEVEEIYRETFEETGLTLGKLHFYGIIHFRSDTWEDEEMYLYTSEEFSGELDENCAEGTLAWVPEDQVMSLPMWEGDRLFLPELLEGAAAIEMTVVYEGDRLKAWY